MMLAARHKLRLSDRRRYERYLSLMQPLVWLPMNDLAGSIAHNAAYGGGTGPELVGNGSPGEGFTFSVADDPDWWGQDQTPPNAEVTEVGSGELNGGSGTGSLNLKSDGSALVNLQKLSLLTAGDTYRLERRASALTGANGIWWQNGGSAFGQQTGAGTQVMERVASAAGIGIYNRYTDVVDVTLDALSIKKVGQFDGVIGGTTTPGKAGLRRTRDAFLFDGATSLITMYNRAAVQGLAEFTLWMLFMPSGAGENNAGTLFSKSGEFELRFNSASRDLIATVNYATTNAQRVTSTTLSANAWHSVGMRIEDTNKLPEIFIDSVEANYASSTPGAGSRVSNTNPLIVGNNVAVSQTLAGLVDEALLFDRALADNDLRQLHLLAGLD